VTLAHFPHHLPLFTLLLGLVACGGNQEAQPDASLPADAGRVDAAPPQLELDWLPSSAFYRLESDADYLYAADDKGILRISPDTTNGERIYSFPEESGTHLIKKIVTSPSHVAWGESYEPDDGGATQERIWVMAKDGSEPFILNEGSYSHFVLHGDYLYFTVLTWIVRKRLDGSSKQEVFADNIGEAYVQGIAAANDYIYWSSWGFVNRKKIGSPGRNGEIVTGDELGEYLEFFEVRDDSVVVIADKYYGSELIFETEEYLPRRDFGTVTFDAVRIGDDYWAASVLGLMKMDGASDEPELITDLSAFRLAKQGDSLFFVDSKGIHRMHFPGGM
jgi:hypothetical protein